MRSMFSSVSWGLLELCSIFLLYFAIVPHHSTAQIAHLSPQTDTFNSTASITAAQAEAANISSTIFNNVNVALKFERTNYANGSVASESFYNVPPKASSAAPGSLLKLQLDANTSAYTLPPQTALSRIMYMTETLNGSAVPASAYILWPYEPLTFLNQAGFPIVAWGHGTSGVLPDCGPSHVKNLWFAYSAPFTLALAGYVVVAPDYAGLGVGAWANGTTILHQYNSHPAAANDLIYAVEAAQSAFPKLLSPDFVVMGQSQGGGAAWSCAQRQVQRPVSGYLGAVAASPPTSTVDFANQTLAYPPPVRAAAANSFALIALRALQSVFPSFDPSTFLTPLGVNRTRLQAEIGGCNSVSGELYADGAPMLQDSALDTPYFGLLDRLGGNGNRSIAGPMLVLHGEMDLAVSPLITEKWVNATCATFPESQLEFATYANVGHVPVLYASQRKWLGWIGDRFRGREVENGCTRERHTPSASPASAYQQELNYFLEYSTQAYQVA